jgi:hypothetical protein
MRILFSSGTPSFQSSILPISLSSILPLILLSVLVFQASADDLQSSLQALSERVLLEESTAAEQAAAEARSDSGAGLELRPGFSEDESSLAVRLYLPSRWTKNKLREQLSLVAESEELRIAALEWQELLSVCRDLCTCRMLNRQRELLNDEIQTSSAELEQVDLAVQHHQFAVADRARLTGQVLDLLNTRDDIDAELLDVKRQLYATLGRSADLDAFAETARIAPPSRLELDELMQQALANRADYRLLDVEAQSLDAATAIARSEDGFRFKHIQSEYTTDQSGDGEGSWSVSAAFTLPWGNRNPDLAVYQKKQMLTLSAMALQRRVIEERLQSLLQTAEAFAEQMERRNRLVQPLVEQLSADLKQLEGGPLGQLRDRMSIREQILNAALQTARMECARARIAVDLAEELGTLGE